MDCRKVEGTDKVALENVRHLRFTTKLRLICDNDNQPQRAQTFKYTITAKYKHTLEITNNI